MKKLAHVYWIGGSACAGKTTVARALAARHDLALYCCDEHFPRHRERADPVRQPVFSRMMSLSPEELFSRDARVLAAELVDFYEEEFEMVVEDLLELAAGGDVLAEGAGLLPTLVAPALESPRRALWLVSTGELRRRLYPDRGPWVREVLARCPDPEPTFRRWMERDDLFAHAVGRAARRRGGRVIAVDGRRSLAETADEAGRRLGLAAETAPP